MDKIIDKPRAYNASAPRPLPSQEYLKSILEYDPETGALKWKRRKNISAQVNSRLVGKVAGSINPVTGYRIIKIDGAFYRSHRLVWKMVTGADPSQVDHRNGDRLDNRWVNLRNVSHQEKRTKPKTTM